MQDAHKFIRPCGGVLVIGPSAVNTIGKYEQRWCWSKEAGGILLGRFLQESEDIIIDSVTEPAPQDRRGRMFFWRNRESAQHAVEEAWRASKHSTNYLGEWHTHPEDEPMPSHTDIVNWKRVTREATYESEGLFFLIAGTKSVKAWELRRGCDEPLHLSPVAP